jgi:hypothetical protein
MPKGAPKQQAGSNLSHAEQKIHSLKDFRLAFYGNMRIAQTVNTPV